MHLSIFILFYCESSLKVRGKIKLDCFVSYEHQIKLTFAPLHSLAYSKDPRKQYVQEYYQSVFLYTFNSLGQRGSNIHPHGKKLIIIKS